MRMRSSARIILFPAYVFVALFVVALIVGVGGLVAFQVQYTGRAYPGVKLQGTDLTGMRPEEIFNAA